MRRLLPLLLFSCVNVKYSEQNIPQYNIIAVMISPNDTQFIYFDRVYKPTEEHGYGLEGANIIVLRDRDTFSFTFGYEKDTLNYYFSVFHVFPKDTLFMLLSFNGDTFKAHTILTDSFSIVQPVDDDTVNVGPNAPILVWTRSKGAFIYKIKPIPIDTNINNIAYFSLDTVSDVFRKSSLFPVDGWYDIFVMAYNHDIHQYYITGVSNIENAYGVFGGVVERKIRVYINTPLD